MSFTVGYTTTPTAGAGNNYTAGFVFANGPYTMPQVGIIRSCSVWLAASPTGTMQIGIYSAISSSQPGTLLAKTAQFAPVAGWNTVNTTTNPIVASGTVIFMGAVDTVSDQTLADANAGFNLFDGGSGFSTLPTTFLNPAHADNTTFQLGAYATFDPTVVGARCFPQSSFDGLNYRSDLRGPLNPNLFPPSAAAGSYGTSANIYSYSSLSYQDYRLPAVNPNLYPPAAPSTPQIKSLLGAPFRSLSYLPESNGSANPNLFPPQPAQVPQGKALFGDKFNGLNYRSDPGPNAFLPQTIQGKVQSLLGNPFNALAYLDTYSGRQNTLGLFAPAGSVTEYGTSVNSTSYDSRIYSDRSIPALNPNLFPPSSAPAPFSSGLLGAPFNGLNYRDYSGWTRNPSLFPTVSVSPFFNTLASVPFNSGSYRDSVVASTAFLPNRPATYEVLSSVNVSTFDTGGYLDSFYGSAFLPSNIQPPVQPLLGVPFSSLSYRDSFVVTGNPDLFPPTAVGSPFVSPLPPAPFNSLSYRETVLYSNINGFLPATIQGQVQSLLGSPFNALGYRDTANIGDNAFLPQTVQPPTSTFLNFIENVAPFDAKSYRDSYVYPKNIELFPPPTGIPFFNPFPFVRFDTKAYADTLSFLTNAFLPGTIQGAIQSLFGVPFNALVFRDPANVGYNAFLPGIIQGQIQSLLGSPFSGLGYRDSFTALRNPSLYAPVAGAPFSTPLFSAIFNALSYRDSAAILRNPSLYTPVVVNPFFLSVFQAAFNSLSYRDVANTGNNAFLPQTIQAEIQSLLGIPFNTVSFRDPANVGINAFLPSIIQGKIQTLLGAPFNASRYQDTSEYPPNAFLPRVIQPPVQPLLGAPFTGLSYREATKYPPNAFLPTIIQGKVQSLLGVPFFSTSYRDSFIAPANLPQLHPFISSIPFILPLPRVPFNSLAYLDTGNYDNPFLPVKFIPGEFIFVQGAVSQIIVLDGDVTQFVYLNGNVRQIEDD